MSGNWLVSSDYKSSPSWSVRNNIRFNFSSVKIVKRWKLENNTNRKPSFGCCLMIKFKISDDLWYHEKFSCLLLPNMCFYWCERMYWACSPRKTHITGRKLFEFKHACYDELLPLKTSKNQYVIANNKSCWFPDCLAFWKPLLRADELHRSKCFLTFCRHVKVAKVLVLGSVIKRGMRRSHAGSILKYVVCWRW